MNNSEIILLSILILIITTFERSRAIYGSCEAARKCCDGKSSNCVVNTAQQYKDNLLLNQVIINKDEDEDGYDDDEDFELCYCDHGCLELGDCCPDYKEYCGVMDCKVGEWSEWTECDVSCGIGTSTRKREVLHPESNGGEPCPSLMEKKTCTASKCSMKKLDKVSALRETAMLLPGKYARSQRRQGRKYDVRANLKSYKYKENQLQYCTVFKVEKAMRACKHNKDTLELRRGNTVCVLCDSKAQRENLGGRCTGHGAVGNKRTRFKNILTPTCHGKWTRVKIIQGPCQCENGPDFIFV